MHIAVEICTIIATLISLFTIVFKWIKAIGKFENTLEVLTSWKTESKNEHTKFEKRFEEHEGQLSNHEVRITVLEKKEGK